ncbi:MAG: hypothetical protein ACRD2U_14545 [Terriglobales bacterium]
MSTARMLMHADVLRGDSGSPADPNDFREYIGVDVALARKTRQPAYIAFEVDPRATSDRGIFIAFIKTMRSGNSWKAALDEDAQWKSRLRVARNGAARRSLPSSQV